MDHHDAVRLTDYYLDKYHRYGYSPAALGWDKGKQSIRFDILTQACDLRGKKILDIGCGFGDLNLILQQKLGDGNYEYCGVDMVDDFLTEGRKRYGNANVRFLKGNFLETELAGDFDFALASGIFNLKLKGQKDNYTFIHEAMQKALGLCKIGFAFDFLSDRVDYQYEHTFHSNPAKVLDMAYGFSRRCVLRNDYMPFEFALYVFKDDSFDKADTLFCEYLKARAAGPSTL